MSEQPESVVITMRGCGYNLECQVTAEEAEPVFGFLEHWWNEEIVGGAKVKSQSNVGAWDIADKMAGL